MIFRRMLHLIAPVLLVGALAGCAPQPNPIKGTHSMSTVDPSMTLEKAKAESLAMQDRLVGFFPAESIATRQTEQTAHLRRCDADGVYLWAGFTKLTFNQPIDTDTVIEAIGKEFETDGRFVVVIKTDKWGDKRVDLSSGDGAGYLITPEAKDHTDITMDAWSPCFLLPDGMSPLDTY